MKQLKLFAVPFVLLGILVAGWMFIGLKVRNDQAARYRLPADASPRTMLEFMREMDGSSEPTQTVFGRFFIEDNQQAIITAVLDASKHVSSESPELTKEESREALFYKIKYMMAALERSYLAGTATDIEALESEARAFLAGSMELGRREGFVAAKMVMFFETQGTQDQRIEFVGWLVAHLRGCVSSSEVSALTTRLERVQRRWQLIETTLELFSTTTSGESFDLNSLRGKVVLMEFWSTSCQSCLADLPALKRIYQQYQTRGFEIVAVCIGTEPGKIRRFAADRQLPWIQLCHDPTAGNACNEKLFDDFGIEVLPTTILLDASGKVVAQGVRPLHPDQQQNLERRLSMLLP